MSCYTKGAKIEQSSEKKSKKRARRKRKTGKAEGGTEGIRRRISSRRIDAENERANSNTGRVITYFLNNITYFNFIKK